MVTANIYDHEKRKRSFAIIAEVGGVAARGQGNPKPSARQGRSG